MRSNPSERSVNCPSQEGFCGDFLSHHGIKNQQWGVRNGPPYPLSSDVHRAVVSGGSQHPGEQKGIVSATVATVLPYVAVKIAANVIAENSRKKDQRKKFEKIDELTDEFIGDISENKRFSNENPPRKISGNHSIEDDMAAINPNYQNGTVDATTNNCALCSFTYDLRRRGYDVTAKPSIEGNFDDLIARELYSGSKTQTLKAQDWNKLYEKATQTYPEGARGIVAVYHYLGTGGHGMAWEVRNGKLEIIDGQRNVRSSVEELTEFGYSPREVRFTRTDHLELNLNNVHKICSELKPDWKATVKARERKQAQEKKAADRRAVEQYKKDHPGTKLTSQEILETLDRKK